MRAWVLAAGLSVLPAWSLAYAPQGVADYAAGRQYQAEGKWAPAVRAYQAALSDDRSLTVAYKALGTVYYMAGDRKGALFFYDRYLAFHASDAATKAFADRLRLALGTSSSDGAQPMTASESASEAHLGGPFRPGFELRMPLTAVFAGAADVDEFYDTPFKGSSSSGLAATNNKPASSLAWASGVGLDYGWSKGFVMGTDLLFGPNRFNTATNALSFYGNNIFTEKDDFAINQLALMLTPGWRFKVGNNMVVETRLGLGIMEASMVQTETDTFSAYATAALAGSPVLNAAGTYSASSSGLGFAIWPEVRGEYLFGQFGVGVSLGYLLNTPTPQKYTAVSSNMSNLASLQGPNPALPLPTVGAGVGYEASPSSTTPTRWYLNTDGLTMGIFISYHFRSVFW